METDAERVSKDQTRRDALADELEDLARSLIKQARAEKWARGKYRDAGAQLATLLREAEYIRAGTFTRKEPKPVQSLDVGTPEPLDSRLQDQLEDEAVDPVKAWQDRHGAALRGEDD